MPVGGEPIKYEMDKAAGTLVVDRFLYTAMRDPGNYGFIPHTLSDDGDPCDVLIANQRHIIPGAVVAVRPVGVLRTVSYNHLRAHETELDLVCRLLLDKKQKQQLTLIPVLQQKKHLSEN